MMLVKEAEGRADHARRRAAEYELRLEQEIEAQSSEMERLLQAKRQLKSL